MAVFDKSLNTEILECANPAKIRHKILCRKRPNEKCRKLVFDRVWCFLIMLYSKRNSNQASFAQLEKSNDFDALLEYRF